MGCAVAAPVQMCTCVSVFVRIHVSMHANSQYVFACVCVRAFFFSPFYMCVSIAGLVEQ